MGSPKDRAQDVSRTSGLGASLPWEMVETFPSTERDLLTRWVEEVDRGSKEPFETVRSHVGCALVLYWAVPAGLESDAEVVLQRRRDLVEVAYQAADRSGDPDLMATARLGRLYALWSPDELRSRARLLDELDELRPVMADHTLALRAREWRVLQCFDVGDLPGARWQVEQFADDVREHGLLTFSRRHELWRANLAMLEGRIDEAVRINSNAISATSQTAGSPFSYQNVAITIGIERYLRRGLSDVIESVRSIRASSPRVATNWDTGLAFCLAEAGEVEAASEIFESLAADNFANVPRDLNWLVTMQLLGLIAVRLVDPVRARALLGLLSGFADLDATHGSGYASYGPVARTCGLLAVTSGNAHDAARFFDLVIEAREPGPWTSLSRLDRARSADVWSHSDQSAELRGAASERARYRELNDVESELTSMGMGAWAERAASARIELVRETGIVPTLMFDSGALVLHGPWGSASVSGVGATALRYLLASPGVAISTVQLEGAGTPGPDGAPIDVDRAIGAAALDASAKTQYRARLEWLTNTSTPLSEEESVELDFLKRALAGSKFPLVGSAEQERSRVRVTKAIRRAMADISEQCPELGEHLDAAVSTGRFCSYEPAEHTEWVLEG